MSACLFVFSFAAWVNFGSLAGQAGPPDSQTGPVFGYRLEGRSAVLELKSFNGSTGQLPEPLDFEVRAAAVETLADCRFRRGFSGASHFRRTVRRTPADLARLSFSPEITGKLPCFDISLGRGTGRLEKAFQIAPRIPAPSSDLAEELERYLTLDGNQFNRLFFEADPGNLASLAETGPPEITGDSATDKRIRALAKTRGYHRQPEALDKSRLVLIEGSQHWLQPEAAEAYLELQSAAAEAGHNLWLVSAFRSYDRQRQIFLSQVDHPYIGGAVNEVLKTSSIPGYSKHHTGYAIDLGDGQLFLGDFALSAGYAWLAADNYLNAKKYGWIPSYPPDGQNQGPEPESWEFTFVGRQHLLRNGETGQGD